MLFADAGPEAAGSKPDFKITMEQLEKHPEIGLVSVGIAGLLLLILLGSLAVWTLYFSRRSSAKPILPVEPWKPRVWGFLDLVLIFLLAFIAQTIGLKAWAAFSGSDLKALAKEDDFPLSAMAIGSLCNVAVMLITMGYLVLRYRVSLEHLGFGLRSLGKRVWLGLLAAAMWIPVVWIIMAISSAGLSTEYNHPLLERLGDESTIKAYLLAVFAAVVVAPITEEFLFRVMLQGWLESLPWSFRNLNWLTGASEAAREADLPMAITPDTSPVIADGADPTLSARPAEAAVMAEQLPTVESANDVTPLQENATVNPYGTANPDAGVPPRLTIEPPMWPVFVSGVLFGLAHLGYGTSFIPLSILGIVLGLLYRATHSIWPSFTVHFALNLIAMLMLGASLVIRAALQ